MAAIIRKSILLLMITANVVCCASTIIEKNVISDNRINCDQGRSLNIFCNNNDIFVLVEQYGDKGNEFLYAQNNWVNLDEYGNLLNCCIKDEHLTLSFNKDNSVNTYNFQEELKPVFFFEYNQEDWFYPKKYITAESSSNYILGSRTKWSTNPLEFLGHVLSGGHGITYSKPYIGQAKDGKIVKYTKLKYGGKRNESFLVCNAIEENGKIHFLGLRCKGKRGQGTAPFNSEVLLCYAGYDLAEKKTVKTQAVHSIKKWDPGSYNFGKYSMAGRNSDVYGVFSFITYPYRGAPHNEIQKISSEIYYFQNVNNILDGAVIIGKGFVPLVKLDSGGNVYVFWIDYEGNFVYKTRKNEEWGKENIILGGIDLMESVYLCDNVIEFDSEDNLHLVYPSNKKLVYSKIRLDEGPNK